MESFEFSYPKYLQSKETVDARALNERVANRFITDLLRENSPSIQILEVGGGIGTTVMRVIKQLEEGGCSSLKYTFVEKRSDNVERAEMQIGEWAVERGYEWYSDENYGILKGDQHPDLLSEIAIDFVANDFSSYVSEENEALFDAIIAQALFDLFEPEPALKTLRSCLRVGGLWYLPIHFDGVTGFEPQTKPSLDTTIEQLYHKEMDAPHSGRRLLTALRNTGAQLLEVGGSDWVVTGDEDGYTEKEEYFLKCILFFIYNTLLSSAEISSSSLAEWIEIRTQQIDRGELIYLTHQLDICANKTKQ